MTDEEWREQHHLFEDMFLALANLNRPTISAICGFAWQGVLSSVKLRRFDCRQRSTFGLPEVTRGIMPGGGGARLLPKGSLSILQKNGYLQGASLP